MKKILLAVVGISLGLSAQPQGMGGGKGNGNRPSFEDRKAKMVEMMESNCQKRLSCIKAAKDQSEMKECRKQAKEDMQERRAKFQEQHKGGRGHGM